jgi:hypothetical protein
MKRLRNVECKGMTHNRKFSVERLVSVSSEDHVKCRLLLVMTFTSSFKKASLTCMFHAVNSVAYFTLG